jgi:hypothetical protein
MVWFKVAVVTLGAFAIFLGLALGDVFTPRPRGLDPISSVLVVSALVLIQLLDAGRLLEWARSPAFTREPRHRAGFRVLGG